MTAYLCCELTGRDLDARILIAAHLLNAGQPVVLGQIWSILQNARTSPAGVMLFATTNAYQAKGMAKCKDAGHIVLAMDEEGLAIRDPKLIFDSVHPDAIAQCDQFLFNDVRQQRVLERRTPHMRGTLTGNPRFELLQCHQSAYGDEAKRHRAAGKYVVFNTNFTMVNSIRGSLDAALEAVASAYDLNDPEVRARTIRDIESDTANRELMLRLIGWLRSHHPEYRIVVRPHPAEKPDTWRTERGIEVVAASNALSWMLGADLVIHSSSTTGLEGILMGVPCINVGEPRRELLLDEVNYCAQTFEQATDAIQLHLSGPGGPIRAYSLPPGFAPSNGARAVAQSVANAVPDLPRAAISTWNAHERTPLQRDKFTVSTDHFMARFQAIAAPLLRAKIRVAPLGDSLFMLTP